VKAIFDQFGGISFSYLLFIPRFIFQLAYRRDIISIIISETCHNKACCLQLHGRNDSPAVTAGYDNPFSMGTHVSQSK